MMNGTENGLTQREIARLLNTDQSTVSFALCELAPVGKKVEYGHANRLYDRAEAARAMRAYYMEKAAAHLRRAAAWKQRGEKAAQVIGGKEGDDGKQAEH